MMELMLMVRVLVRRWWLLLIPVVIVLAVTLPDLIGGGDAVSGGFNTTIKYSAAQEFNLPNRDGDYQDVWLASEFVVNAFTEWVRSNSFRAELDSQLNGTLDLALMGIASDNERSVGVIYISYPTAEGLESISNATIDILQNENQDYFPQLGGDPAQVTLLETPVILPAPPPLANRFEPLLRIGVALVLGFMLVILAEWLDPTFHQRDELEAVGVRVLTTIPRR